mmetsp:Transcript_38199/g.83056  ORF Transcript_38199/g.83056 Transcript_38199/m.83056 type:complete len:140 (+) Transcript_38199:87-506(+)
MMPKNERINASANSTSRRGCLTDEDLGFVGELVRGDLKVKRGGTLTDTAAGVVMRTVAGAEPTVVLPGVTDGDAAQVGADAKNDKPLRLEGAVIIGLLITKMSHGYLRFGRYLIVGAVTDEDGLTAPLDGDGLTDVNLG